MATVVDPSKVWLRSEIFIQPIIGRNRGIVDGH